MREGERPGEHWSEAMAEVTECHYDVRAGRALAFGLTSAEHFRISYNYRVGDELHTGECFSKVARLQGSLFQIRYDPDLPHVSQSGKPARGVLPVLVSVGVAGSIALLLIWLLVLRGC